MYPAGELELLARRKTFLRLRITMHRMQITQASSRLARPLGVIEQLWAKWRQISPFVKMAAVPLGMMAKKKFFPKMRIFSALVKWGPAIFSSLRSMGVGASGDA